MRNKKFIVSITVIMVLGTGLSPCNTQPSRTATQTQEVQPALNPPATLTATNTQTTTGEFTETQSPATLSINTSTPTPQPTETQGPLISPSDTQTQTAQPSDTQVPVNTATAPSPGVDGATLLQERCTVCHSLARVTSRQLTIDQWQNIVNRMIQRGAQLTSSEYKILVEYLAETDGP